MTTATAAKSPVLAIGRFGLHINQSPSGAYVFVGTVPQSLSGVKGSYDECYEAFKAWFKILTQDEKRQYAPDLRNDVFVDFANCGIW